MRDDDRGLDDRYEPERSWRPEDRGERDDHGRVRFDPRFDQRFDQRSDQRFDQRFDQRLDQRLDPRFDQRFDDPPGNRDDRGWSRRDERFSESDRSRASYGVRDRDDRSRGELHGHRTTVEAMPRQDQLLRGAYRDHDESNRDLSYRSGAYGEPADPRSSSAREPMPQRRGPHAGKGPVGFQRSDERIRELVCEALTDDDEIDASRIEVNVKGGEVTLTGAIGDRQMKRLAEDCVEAIPGVKDVHNQLRIGESPSSADRGGQGADRAADKHDRHERTAESPDRKHRPS